MTCQQNQEKRLSILECNLFWDQVWGLIFFLPLCERLLAASPVNTNELVAIAVLAQLEAGVYLPYALKDGFDGDFR